MKAWAPDEIERLRGLWTAGIGATEIGIVMGRSRNSVIGKLNRLGLLGTERYKHRISKITLAGSANRQ